MIDAGQGLRRRRPGHRPAARRHRAEGALPRRQPCPDRGRARGRGAPGERTGVYRIGGDDLLADSEGRSVISAEDYAVAVADELESGAHPRRRITVAY
ncbi:hypothetical protein [Nonomuraea basaltis]|uniref:hypothetical protein n=1 Tax=Nonomuraea basaltis TaxID=2495887 RepID=UPI001980310C|nr:hypothetical protein [Nonomuraea basaltis]